LMLNHKWYGLTFFIEKKRDHTTLVKQRGLYCVRSRCVCYC